MKKLFYSIFAFAALTITSCGTTEDTESTEAAGNATEENHESESAGVSGTYTTAEGASVVWKAKHIGDADFVHVGTVATSGNVIVDNNAILGGEFSFDIVNLDEEGDTDYTKMLEGHLQDTAFFFTIDFPTATYKVTGSDAGMISGELTVLGNTHPLDIEGDMMIEGDGVSFKGMAVVDMETFGMKGVMIPEGATEDQINQSPDGKVTVEIDLNLAKVGA